MTKYLGIVVMPVEADSPEAAQAVLDKHAQQARYRLDRVSKARAGNVASMLWEGVTPEEFAAVLRLLRSQLAGPKPPPAKGDPT